MNINLEMSEDAVKLIAQEGLDLEYGARPLKRAIQTKIEDKLSEEMLDLKVKDGMNLVCDFVDDKFVFNVK